MNRGNKTAFITENMVYFTSAVKASEAIPGGKKKKIKWHRIMEELLLKRI